MQRISQDSEKHRSGCEYPIDQDLSTLPDSSVGSFLEWTIFLEHNSGIIDEESLSLQVCMSPHQSKHFSRASSRANPSITTTSRISSRPTSDRASNPRTRLGIEAGRSIGRLAHSTGEKFDQTRLVLRAIPRPEPQQQQDSFLHQIG